MPKLEHKIQNAIHDFIGNAPVQSVLEISSGSAPFLKQFSGLYVHGAQSVLRAHKKAAHETLSGKKAKSPAKTVKQKKDSAKELPITALVPHSDKKQSYDIIFAHSFPSAAAEKVMLSLLFHALRPSGKMVLLLSGAADMRNLSCSEAELAERLRAAELQLVNSMIIADAVKKSRAAAGKGKTAAAGKRKPAIIKPAEHGGQRLYLIQNPQMLMA